MPVPWPTATPPAGWLKCDGRAFTNEQYPVLARVYPTLRLPDLRGEFIRGWDDGRKIDEGRKLLSWQKGTLVGGHDDNDSALDISYMSNGNNIDYGGDKVFAGNYRSDYSARFQKQFCEFNLQTFHYFDIVFYRELFLENFPSGRLCQQKILRKYF